MVTTTQSGHNEHEICLKENRVNLDALLCWVALTLFRNGNTDSEVNTALRNKHKVVTGRLLYW